MNAERIMLGLVAVLLLVFFLAIVVGHVPFIAESNGTAF